VTQALVPIDADADLILVDKVRAAIAELSSLDEARDFIARASTAASYFRRAQRAQAAVNAAVEAQIWAERRAGQLLSERDLQPGKRAAYAASLGTSSGTLRRWRTFAGAAEGLLQTVIAGMEVLSVEAVYHRLSVTSAKRIERGIYQNSGGVFFIRWRERGVGRRQLVGEDLAAARFKLAVATGQAKERTRRLPTRYESGLNALSIAYGDVRIALQHLDRLLADGTVPRDTKERGRRAMASLHAAEDEITAAIRDFGYIAKEDGSSTRLVRLPTA